MKILATVKRVIDPDVKAKLTDEDQLDPASLKYKLNTFDEYSVEEAVRLKEKGAASEIVVVCVGPADAQKEIRTALAMGADRGILVEADNAEELDTLTKARLLAAVIEKESPDIVLLGKLSVDTESNAVGQMLGALTGFPQATFAYEVNVDGGKAVVGREVDGGTMEVEVQLPAIITADLRLNEPRYASLPGIMKAKRKPLDTLTPDDLGVEADPVVRTLGYELPPERKAGEMLESVDELFDKLRNEAKVL